MSNVSISVTADVKKAKKQPIPHPKEGLTKNNIAGFKQDGRHMCKRSSFELLHRETGIKPQKVVKARTRVFKSSPRTLRATVEVMETRAPNLIRFKATQNKKGVAASAWGKRKTYRGAFIGNSGRTVFARTSKTRLPIKPLYGPSVSNEMKRPYAQAIARKTIKERFPINFNQALKFNLSKLR